MSLFTLGLLAYLIIRVIMRGFFTIDQNERAVKTVFGKAQRLGARTTAQDSISATLAEDEKLRYDFPLVEVIGPGLHFKWPWERIHRVSIATVTVPMAYDPDSPKANRNNNALEAVTRDQLNIHLMGQIRFRVCEQNLYAYIFGIKNPVAHVMGFFVSILREHIARFESKREGDLDEGVNHQNSNAVSINDLRKNLREINDLMVKECETSSARYGVVLEASLITAMEPPTEVEAALAAINTAYNNVSSEISLAKAGADQTIVQSKRAVEIETLKAQAEIEPLNSVAEQLRLLKAGGADVLEAFVRNVRINTFRKANRIILPSGEGH